MRTIKLLPVAVLALGMSACDLLKGGGPEVCEPAEASLRSGDLPGAMAKYEELNASSPDNPCVVKGYAYVLTLAGNYDAADSVLAGSEEAAGEALGEVKLRRALVAFRAGNLDAVKQHGADSGIPAGQVLAAEVHLADAESDEAIELLKMASGAGGDVGRTASAYLDMLEAGDGVQAGLAEVTALWALGQREAAVEAAGELVTLLPDDQEDKSEQLLLWAGRAVTSGHPDVARMLLDNVDFPPDGQQWRMQATQAMIEISEGNTDGGVETFTMLAAGGAPADGLSDALATAACLTSDRAVAKQLAGEVESAGAARCLLEAGARGAARKVVPGGSMGQYLENL